MRILLFVDVAFLLGLCMGIGAFLQGCGPGSDDGDDDNPNGKKGDPSKERLQEKLRVLELAQAQSCEARCVEDAQYGRWRRQVHAHSCWNEEDEEVYCECSPDSKPSPQCSPLTPEQREANNKGGSSLVDVEADMAGLASESRSASRTRLRHDKAGTANLRAGGTSGSGATTGLRTVSANDATMASVVAEFDAEEEVDESGIASPRETVNKFCDKEGLSEMHGGEAARELELQDASRDFESKILGDVARELETNNVHKMAQEIFSFYICTRWAPDNIFWHLAQHELAAQLNMEVVEVPDRPDEAIAEAYQTYKFVPMLCSYNLEVFKERTEGDLKSNNGSASDFTSYTKFEEDVTSLAKWVQDAASGPVLQQLQNIDKLFCGDKPMNDCKGRLDKTSFQHRMRNLCPRFLCGDNPDQETLLDQMQKYFKAFKVQNLPDSGEWDADFRKWKAHFPFHSFIGKPEGFGDTEGSPWAHERFVICFGKRVASELHRRPNGRHILTDQNNVGCHGWWDAEKTSQMLNRIVQLWKPPTCQLATMTYTMKKEILAKFQQMNERLFDSLPSQINDELMQEELGAEEFDFHDHLPVPFDQKALTVTGADGSRKTLVDGMRVRAIHDACLDCAEWDELGTTCRSCAYSVSTESYGRVEVIGDQLHVYWDEPHGQTRRTEATVELLEVVPVAWRAKVGFLERVQDFVAGVTRISDKAKQLFNSMFGKKYKNLSKLMSGSVSKWAVCPVKSGSSKAVMADLDRHLGVEDAAFQDFQKEAYAKWTGYRQAIPGTKCIDAQRVVGKDQAEAFQGCQACEISELHEDHPEAYFPKRGQAKQEFVCPLRPPLPADEQLSILLDHEDQCFVSMTDAQEVHHQWYYQGLFPARQQYEHKENPPLPEMDLVKLLNVPGKGITGETTYARLCSMEEKRHAPRFCTLPPIHNNYGTVEAFADSLSDTLTGTLGVGASAVTATVRTFEVAQAKEKDRGRLAKEAIITASEKTWDKLVGAGRLLRSSAQYVAASLKGQPPGAERIGKELEDRYFGANLTGEVLHRLSFQRSIGKNWESSNAKERYQRYVLSCPCRGFDPVLTMASQKRWSSVALRMVKAAWDVPRKSKDVTLLSKRNIVLNLRGEALRFREVHSHANSTHHHKWAAAIQWVNGASDKVAPPPSCHWNFMKARCEPTEFCHYSFPSCVPKVLWSNTGWTKVQDKLLQDLVAPVMSGDLHDLYGLQLSMHCAPKSKFQHTGPPQEDPESLEKCLREGVVANAEMRAREPWKLYYPDEVVVMARFDPIQQRYCAPSSEADGQARSALCKGAIEDQHMEDHLEGMDKTWTRRHKYMGVLSGVGYPRATLEEVFLKPEDVLEALGLMPPSHVK